MLRTKWFALLGTVIFLAGEGLALSLSGVVIWAELEARFRSHYNAEQIMPLECPLMIAPFETAVIEGTAINFTEKDIQPVIRTEFSRDHGTSESSEPLPLTSRESRPLKWTATSEDIIFDRLILFNVLQSQYRDNPARRGSCGIVLYSLWGLGGTPSFLIGLTASILGLLIGGWLWIRSLRPLGSLHLNIARAGAVLAGITILALLSTSAHWWGLALILNTVSLLFLGTVFIDFLLFPQHNK